MSTLPPPSSARQTDVRKRTVLPTTLQNLRSTTSASGPGSSSQAELDQLNSEEYLNKLEEELNRKVDGEVEGLVEGLKELVALARVSHSSSLSRLW
jgi:mediator of RNA polymerase II transcription subunit 22